jgi:CubicO group peptidase (beta-lactamase class C family)
MKRIIRLVLLALLVVILGIVGYLAFTFPPVMTGMAAKTMCSCVFATGRTPESVVQQELQVFPGLASIPMDINHTDSTVSASLLGRTAKAIFRKGLGCTLLFERPEADVRRQPVRLATPPPFNPDTVDWPAGNRIQRDTLPAHIDYAAVKKAVDEAFVDVNPHEPIFTHAVVVVHNNELIAEKYAEGYDINSRCMGWSMTKSITNMLVGILVKEGKIGIEDPAPVAEWQNDDRKNITVNNLLQASSGLAWSETYFNPTADFHSMFIKSDDKAAYAASRPLKHEPGTFFQYSSGTTNILSRIIREKTGDDYYAFPYEKLFYPLGIRTAIIEPDASGTFVASSYSYASARDWARLGMLYLNDGVWGSKRILPAGWVKYSVTPNTTSPRREYGAQIWLNRGAADDSTNVKYPGLPNEAILFDGFEENTVLIIPSKKLVIVRLGVTHNRNFSLPKLATAVMNAVQ